MLRSAVKWLEPCRYLTATVAASQQAIQPLAVAAEAQACQQQQHCQQSSLGDQVRLYAQVASTSKSAASSSAAASLLAKAPASSASPAPERPSLLLDKPSTQLSSADIGNYYSLQEKLIPEAFPGIFQAFYAPRDPSYSRQRRAGCTGLQDEVSYSGRPALMYRRCMHDLQSALQYDEVSKVLLRGPQGSGKSLALLGLVEWARAKGWLVMYLPSASQLTHGGFFTKRPDSDLYDTIISAQHILKAMQEAHGAQLKQLPCQLPQHQGKAATLGDLLQQGLARDDNARLAVECCLGLQQELLRLASPERPVLFAIDDYNALHWATDYGAVVDKAHRRMLTVENLPLASGFRLLSQADVGQAKVVGALTWSAGISSKLEVPTRQCHTFFTPRYSQVEAAHALVYYHDCGVAPEVPSERQVQQLLALTNGNAKELRQNACKQSLLKVNVL